MMIQINLNRITENSDKISSVRVICVVQLPCLHRLARTCGKRNKSEKERGGNQRCCRVWQYTRRDLIKHLLEGEGNEMRMGQTTTSHEIRLRILNPPHPPAQ